MATETIELTYQRSAKQKAFHDAVLKHEVTGFRSGIGGGKTFAGAWEAIRHAFQLMPGSRGGIISPTFRMLQRDTQYTFLQILPPKLIQSFNKSENIMTLVNGTRIDFCSMEHPERNRGPNWDWWWGDEMSLWTKHGYDIILGRMRGSRDDYRESARGWGTFTPKRGLWLKDELEKPGCTCIASTSMDNPHLTERFLERLKSSYTGAFYRQEVLGEFVKFEGLIWPELDEATHRVERQPSEMVRYIAGVDWGFTNPFGIGVIGVDGDGRYHIFEEVYETKLTPDDQLARAEDLAARYPIQVFWCGPDQPGNIEAWQRAGLPAQAANNEVIPGIQSVAGAVRIAEDGKPRLTVSEAAPCIWDDCAGYQWKEGQHGELKGDQPLKVKDHGADLVRYAIHSDTTESGGEINLVILGGDDDE